MVLVIFQCDKMDDKNNLKNRKKEELKKLTGFDGNRGSFNNTFLIKLHHLDIGQGVAVKICNSLLMEIDDDFALDVEKRLDELLEMEKFNENPNVCVKCGGNLLKYANYCTYCGFRIPDEIKNKLLEDIYGE